MQTVLKHAGGSKLQVLGSHSICIIHNGKKIETEVYFVSGVTNIYLSLSLCKKLSLVHEQFPHVNIANSQVSSICKGNAAREIPIRPLELPYPATEDNVLKLEAWLLKEFKDTVFNTRDSLPFMTGQPFKIHLEENAIPYIAHTPIPTPHHWKEDVKKQLDEDVRLGIIRKAPVGKAYDWCMRMVTVPKSDGSPRRTVDFQPLNKFCKREIHHTPSPIEIVSSIPKETYKTALDAKDAYNQVLMSVESIELTTFITEFGAYQYLRTPQGHNGSKDAYTRRYDDITKDVVRKKKSTDDTLLYDTTIKDAFFHTLII